MLLTASVTMHVTLSIPLKLQRELGWEPSLQFEEGIEKTVRWYLDNQEWLDNVTSGDYQSYYEKMYSGR